METKDWMIRNFPVDLQKKLKMQALKQDMTLKALVIKVLSEYVERKEKGKK